MVEKACMLAFDISFKGQTLFAEPASTSSTMTLIFNKKKSEEENEDNSEIITLKIANIPTSITEEALLNELCRHGELDSFLLLHKQKAAYTTEAHFSFAKTQDARKLLEGQMIELAGVKLGVKKLKSQHYDIDINAQCHCDCRQNSATA